MGLDSASWVTNLLYDETRIRAQSDGKGLNLVKMGQ